MNPLVPPPPHTVLDRLHSRVSTEVAERLLRNVIAAGTLRPSFTIAKAAAYVIAAGVHLSTVLSAAAGIYLILSGWPGFFPVVLGCALLGIAWVMRPRLGRMPKDGAPREQLPALHALCDRVADSVGARRAHVIVLDDSMNASIIQLGIRQRTVLMIGLPLFYLLDAQERVALIAHEFGHTVNGDCMRSRFVGTALRTLETWYAMLMDTPLTESEGIIAVAMPIVRMFMKLLAGCVWLVLYVLNALVQYESQRAEYLADYHGAATAGRDAILGLLVKVELKDLFEYAVQRRAMNVVPSLFDELTAQLAAMPNREWERIRRALALESSRIDYTHPPTAMRIRFMQEVAPAVPSITLNNYEIHVLDAELAPAYAEVEESAIARYERSLYW